MKRHLYGCLSLCFALALLSGVGAREQKTATIEFSSVRVDGDIEENAELAAMIAPYRKGVEEYSREVVGQAAEDLNSRRKPENGISNLVADAIRELGSEAFETEVDIAISNFGGLRRSLDQGPVTVGLVTELSPFENFLVLVEGKGDLVLNIARQLALRGGEPMSGMELVYGEEGEILDLKIGGKEIDEERTYRIVTLDYLYGVDENIWDRSLIANTTMSGVRQRDAIIEYMKRLNAKGIAIRDEGDGRIKQR